MNIRNFQSRKNIISYHKKYLELHGEFLFVYVGSGGLVLLLVVNIEADGGVGINLEPVLDHLPNPQDGLGVCGVS